MGRPAWTNVRPKYRNREQLMTFETEPTRLITTALSTLAIV